jgi:hypothetical protein
MPYAWYLYRTLFCRGQNKTHLPKENTRCVTKDTVTSYGPPGQIRNVKRGSNGTILITSSVAAVFRYDGKSSTKLTSKIGPSRFWDVLEDRRGNLWFASMDSGVYNYNGKSFKHFTTREGLVNNMVFLFMKIKPALFCSAPEVE